MAEHEKLSARKFRDEHKGGTMSQRGKGEKKTRRDIQRALTNRSPTEQSEKPHPAYSPRSKSRTNHVNKRKKVNKEGSKSGGSQDPVTKSGNPLTARSQEPETDVSHVGEIRIPVVTDAQVRVESVPVTDVQVRMEPGTDVPVGVEPVPVGIEPVTNTNVRTETEPGDKPIEDPTPKVEPGPYPATCPSPDSTSPHMVNPPKSDSTSPPENILDPNGPPPGSETTSQDFKISLTKDPNLPESKKNSENEIKSDIDEIGKLHDNSPKKSDPKIIRILTASGKAKTTKRAISTSSGVKKKTKTIKAIDPLDPSNNGKGLRDISSEQDDKKQSPENILAEKFSDYSKILKADNAALKAKKIRRHSSALVVRRNKSDTEPKAEISKKENRPRHNQRKKKGSSSETDSSIRKGSSETDYSQKKDPDTEEELAPKSPKKPTRKKRTVGKEEKRETPEDSAGDKLDETIGKKKKLENEELKLEPQGNRTQKKFDDLPEDIQRKCTQLKLDREKMEKNMDALLTVATFLFKSSFPNEEEPAPSISPQTRRRPYVTAEQAQCARQQFQKPSKPIKKMFKTLQLSGRGGFGSVWIAKDSTSKKSQKVAIKQLPHNTDRAKQNNESEVYFLSTCKHANIVLFYQSFLVQEKDNPDELWIMMEHLEGGTLSEAAKAHQFSDKHVAYTAREMLKGIKYLHDNKFAHRDLKSANVMMSIKGEIKLIDFGLCADFSEGSRIKILGSPYWIPPEMILGQPHSYPVDIWSFAVCVLELYLSAPPHNVSALKCMFLACTEGLSDTIPERATPLAKDFLQKCLVVDPSKRATASELLLHPWVTQSNLETGITDILKQIFLSASLETLGF